MVGLIRNKCEWNIIIDTSISKIPVEEYLEIECVNADLTLFRYLINIT